MAMMEASTVAGIDIGGDRKGCHLVILRGTRILCNIKSRAPEYLLQTCIGLDVVAVGIDAPCQWGAEGKGRLAEKELAQRGVFCFARADASASKRSLMPSHAPFLGKTSPPHDKNARSVDNFLQT